MTKNYTWPNSLFNIVDLFTYKIRTISLANYFFMLNYKLKKQYKKF